MSISQLLVEEEMEAWAKNFIKERDLGDMFHGWECIR